MGGAGLDYTIPRTWLFLPLLFRHRLCRAIKVEKLKVQIAEAKKAFDDIQGTPEGLAKGRTAS